MSHLSGRVPLLPISGAVLFRFLKPVKTDSLPRDSQAVVNKVKL